MFVSFMKKLRSRKRGESAEKPRSASAERRRSNALRKRGKARAKFGKINFFSKYDGKSPNTKREKSRAKIRLAKNIT